MGTSDAGCGASTGAAVGEQRAQCPARRAARAGCRALRTAHSWRGVLPFTHLAREGRMTVTIGRRELLVALGGAAAAWPLAAGAAVSHQRICSFWPP